MKHFVELYLLLQLYISSFNLLSNIMCIKSTRHGCHVLQRFTYAYIYIAIYIVPI